MLDVLGDILCACLVLPWVMADLLVGLVNLFFVGVGAALVGILALLPAFPDPPADPPSQALAYANWLFPIAGLLAILTTVAGLWLGFIVLRIVLRWLKAV